VKEGIDAVAVRSSSALEDLEGASFAGQYETILNVRSLPQLEKSIKRCWASFFSTTVRVLIQGMIQSKRIIFIGGREKIRVLGTR
jgi:phosphoenolpyruvate synthase/pyruvate phosphate dikinase